MNQKKIEKKWVAILIFQFETRKFVDMAKHLKGSKIIGIILDFKPIAVKLIVSPDTII